MNSESILCESITDLSQKLTEITNRFQPTLAFVFANKNCNIEAINEELNKRSIQFIGCSTAGEIKDSNLVFDSIGMLLMEVSSDKFKIVHNNYGETIFEDARNLGITAKETFENPGIIIFSGGIAVDGYQIVEGIKEVLGNDLPIFGGLGGNNLNFFETICYSNNFLSKNGYSSIVFDTDKIKLEGIAISGWDGLGKTNTISKSKNNIVYEINNVPAFEELKKYFGEELFMQPENNSQEVIAFPGQFPLKIYRDNGNTFLRAIVNINTKDNSIVLAGSVPEGCQFKYCPSPGIEEVTDTVNIYKERLGVGKEIDSLLMISCLIRHHSFGPLFEEEIRSIYQLWKKPMAGFLSYGEIGNTGDNAIVEFHNATCSLVGLSEVV